MTPRQQFKKAIHLGTGDAYLIQKQNPNLDLTKEILHAATQNLAYDRQCEGNRAWYIYNIINASAFKEEILKKILALLLFKKDDQYALDQMCTIAALYASQGNIKAREALYKRFQKNIKPDYAWCYNDSIIFLDGISGLIRVADLTGQLLQKYPDNWEDGSTADFFQKENPNIDVYKQLRKAAKTNNNIKKYLSAIKENKKIRQPHQPRQPYTYSLIKEKIAVNSIKYIHPNITRELNKDEIEQIANDFLKEKNEKSIVQYLKIFTHIQFPYGYKPIMDIAKRYPDGSNIPVFFFSLAALALFTSAGVRLYAFSKITASHNPGIFLILLKANYKKDDHKIINKAIERIKNIDKLHTIAHGIRDIYSTNKNPQCLQPIMSIYEKINCGMCRYEFARILLANNILPDKIKQQLPYDSYKDTRALLLSN